MPPEKILTSKKKSVHMCQIPLLTLTLSTLNRADKRPTNRHIWWRIFLVTGHSQTLNSHKLFCDDFKKLINIFVDVDSVVVLIVWKIFYSYPYISRKAKKCNLSHGTLRTHIFTTQILTSNFSECVKVWNLKFGILHLRLLNNDFVKRNPQFS